MNKEFYLIAFASTQQAMCAETYFKNNNANVKLIPLPSAIASGCGFSIKILPHIAENIKPLLQDAMFKDAKFYNLKKQSGNYLVSEWVFNNKKEN